MNNKIHYFEDIKDLNKIKIPDKYPICNNNNIDCIDCIDKSYSCRIYKRIWITKLPCCLEITDDIQRKYHIMYEIKKPNLKYKFRFSQ